MNRTVTARHIAAAFARSMREFGYPDVTDEIALEIYEAFKAGKRDSELPHGIIGMMGDRQFTELKEAADAAGKALP